MPGWGLGFLLIGGLVLSAAGSAIGLNWRNLGSRTYGLCADNGVLPGFYRRRGQAVFRLWIGGGAAVFGLALVVASVAGLTAH